MFVEGLRRRWLLHGWRAGAVRGDEGGEGRRGGKLLRRLEEREDGVGDPPRPATADQRRRRPGRTSRDRPRAGGAVEGNGKEGRAGDLPERRPCVLQRRPPRGLQRG